MIKFILLNLYSVTLTIILSISLLLAVLSFWRIYNQLIIAQNIVNEAFSGIDVQLKKRFELIPNLVESVKGYNSHEAETLIEVIRLRQTETNSKSETISDDQSITSALKNFRLQIENYPTLKANFQFLKLMDELSLVENELSMSRRYYNGATRDYNSKIQMFPGVIVARVFKFIDQPFFDIEKNDERNIPQTNLNEK